MFRKYTIGICLVIGCVGIAWGAVPQTLTYQGYLKNTDGTPVNTATNVKFALYSSTSGAGAVWTSSTVSVTPANGIYSIELGPIDLPFDRPYYLGVTAGADPEMRPLQALASVPYAMRARSADTVPSGAITDSSIAGTISATKLDLSTVVAKTGDVMTGPLTLPANGLTVGTDQIVASAGNVGIGTASPSEKLEVAGTAKATAFAGDGSGITNIKYAKVALVGQSGANYTSPVAAMTDIAAWCGTPSDTNRCMMKILPGVYDLGSTSLVMTPYVDIEGSGENTTILAGTVSNATIPPTSGVVNGASNAEIRSLTIRNTGTGTYVVAMLNTGGASPKMTNITATTSGGTNNYGVRNSSSSPVMTNVTATASGGTSSHGVSNFSSSPTMTNIAATASDATNNYGISLTSSSPTMTNVVATASGGTTVNYALYNTSSSSPTLSNVTATASGGGNTNAGMYNSSSSPVVKNLVATASGGTYNYGVFNSSSPLTMSNVTATGKLGTNNYGLYTDSASAQTIFVDGSSFEGSTGSIYNNSILCTLKIGASKLIGPKPTIGTIIYLSSYSDTVALGSVTTGSQTFHTGGDANVGLVVKANSTTQSANLQEWRDSAGAVKASVSAAGVFTGSMSTASLTGTVDIAKGGTGATSAPAARTNLAVPGTTTANTFTTGVQTIQTGGDANLGLVVKGNTATQSANLQEWQDSTGAVKASVSAAGVITGNASGLSNIKYPKMAIVAQSGGNYTSPITAMNDIDAWCGTPSETNPCLMKILPGIYDLVEETLTMQQYVDIEGSGENVTILAGSASSGTRSTCGMVFGASNAEIRFLTIRNTGTGLYRAAMVNDGGASPRVTNVTLIASGGGMSSEAHGVYNYTSSPTMNNVTATASGATYNYGVHNYSSSPTMINVAATASGSFSYGVYNNNPSSPTMNNVTATASGTSYSYGVYNYGSTPTMSNITATASGASTSIGIYNNGGSGTVTIDHSRVRGSSYTIYLDGTITTRVGSSKLDGPVSFGNNNLTCVGAYNGNYVALSTSCQ